MIDNNNKKTEEKYSLKNAIAYGFGQFSDTIAYQLFTFLIFTFYYAIIKIDVFLITIAFIIWSFWNVFNDPLLGSLSDRTRTKWGRQKPFILIAIAPLCVIMVLLWTPPLYSYLNKFMYFFIIIIIFEFFYTMFAVNRVSLFPEIYQNLTHRAKAIIIRHIFTVFALIFAVILPTIIIPDLIDPMYQVNYFYTGVLMSIIIAIGALIFIKFGINERVEFSEDHKEAPSLFKSLKISLKNKAFITYIIAGLVNWYVYGMLPTIVPLYGTFVLVLKEDQLCLDFY